MPKRESGIVMPITSLPGPHGIGTIGEPARKFIDFMVLSGQRYWQVLPLSPTGYGDSPYQSCSANAGNPYMIDLEELINEGLLERCEVDTVNFGDDIDLVDYGQMYLTRMPVLRKAYERGCPPFKDEFDAFKRENAHWLPDYALYMACKEGFGMIGLKDWPDKRLIERNPASVAEAAQKYAVEIEFHEFVQFLFFSQWRKLREYATENGILIFGDMPIYVSEDSVEVWTHPELFLLSEPAKPSLVAGVPPDLYSETGQLWGNPIYDWAYHEKTGYRWWIGRMKHAASLFDVIRIDHFRGFHNYWVIKAGEETALSGEWRVGPGLKFVELMKKALPDDSLIAEDLGDLDDSVREFFKATGLPGMRVLVYAFDPDDDSEYMPHNMPVGSVAYTSTHDSPAFMDWLNGEATPEQRQFAWDYLRLREDEGLNWCAVKTVWGSPSYLAMAPFGDILGLAGDGRINIPSTLGGRNWRWRVRGEALNEEVAELLRDISITYRRYIPPKPPVEDKTELEAEE